MYFSNLGLTKTNVFLLIKPGSKNFWFIDGKSSVREPEPEAGSRDFLQGARARPGKKILGAWALKPYLVRTRAGAVKIP